MRDACDNGRTAIATTNEATRKSADLYDERGSYLDFCYIGRLTRDCRCGLNVSEFAVMN